MAIQGEFFEVKAEQPERVLAHEVLSHEVLAHEIERTPTSHAHSKRGMKDLSIPKLYYSISEVSRLTGLEQYVLRYWETVFDELRPQKNRAGNRVYSNKDIKFILKIKELLREKRYTIEGAKQLLKENRHLDPDLVQEEVAEAAVDPQQMAIIPPPPPAAYKMATKDI